MAVVDPPTRQATFPSSALSVSKAAAAGEHAACGFPILWELLVRNAVAAPGPELTAASARS
jgi:hypothetical protein